MRSGDDVDGLDNTFSASRIDDGDRVATAASFADIFTNGFTNRADSVDAGCEPTSGDDAGQPDARVSGRNHGSGGNDAASDEYSVASERGDAGESERADDVSRHAALAVFDTAADGDVTRAEYWRADIVDRRPQPVPARMDAGNPITEGEGLRGQCAAWACDWATESNPSVTIAAKTTNVYVTFSNVPFQAV